MSHFLRDSKRVREKAGNDVPSVEKKEINNKNTCVKIMENLPLRVVSLNDGLNEPFLMISRE